MSFDFIARIIKGIFMAMGGFLALQGGYSILSSKIEHKPDQGADAWWTIGLAAFCMLVGSSNFIDTIFASLSGIGG